MHLLVLSHAYPCELERLREEFDKHGYVDETTEAKVRYPAVWRELRMWDICIPEGCQADFLMDIASFCPHPGYLKDHTPGLHLAMRVLLRVLRLFGIKEVAVPMFRLGKYFQRRVNGEPKWVWLIPLGSAGELRGEHGEEQV